MKPVNRPALTLALLAAAALHLGSASVTYAQKRQKQLPSYQPSRSTVSPYLQLLRRDQGPLPNYQFFLRPRVAQQQFNQRQQQNVRSLQRDFSRLETGSAEFTTGVRAGFRTGTSRFRTASGYFRSHQPPR